MEMNMLEMWPAILFGWPAILVALVLSVIGIVRRRARWLVVAAVIVLPFSLYLAGSPVFGWLGLSIPLLLPAASIAIYHHHTKVAWFLLAPFVGVSGWLAIAVMSQ
jgi:hypothetical protein